MRRLVLATLACVACREHARRLQISERLQDATRSESQTSLGSTTLTPADMHQPTVQAEVPAPFVHSSLRVLAVLLFAGCEVAAFTTVGPKSHFSLSRPRSVIDEFCPEVFSRVPRAVIAAAADTSKLPVVVVGGGIVGLTAAYYLLRMGEPVTIVEKRGIGCHASGKAAGLLAGGSDWHVEPTRQLAEHSFDLHVQLALNLGEENLGFREVNVVGRSHPGDIADNTPNWISSGFEQDMGEQRVVQVTPYKFMDELLAVVTKNGAEVVIATATGVDMDNRRVSAVNVKQHAKRWSIPCSKLILAMGPWAKDAAPWFPGSYLPRCTVGNRYTSVIWDDAEIGKNAKLLFVSGNRKVEMIPRFTEAYATGCPSMAPLPEDPMEIVPLQKDVDDVIEEVLSAVKPLRQAQVIRKEAYFLASSDDGLPVIGPVPETTNAVISCAGGYWSFLNGPAMGEAAADLITGEIPQIDLIPFDPARFDLAKICRAQKAGVPANLLGLAARYPGISTIMRKAGPGRHELVEQIQKLQEKMRTNPELSVRLEEMLEDA